MNFKKDILLVDLETTGLDPSRHEIIQLAAVLLDKKTLKEKKSLNTYVRPGKWKNRNAESMKVNGITWQQVKDAPGIKEVVKGLEKQFDPRGVIFAHYGGPVDHDFLRAAYRKLHKPFNFDYHYFNIWALFYGYLAANNRLSNKKRFTGFTLEDLMKRFRIKSNNRHDALEDCRVEAEVLRRVIANIRI